MDWVIPAGFQTTIREAFREEGAAWLETLPACLTEVAEAWRLRVDPPFALSYNYVAPATRADGAAVVLKVSYPSREARNEAAALRAFAGRGAVPLLAHEPAHAAMLLERLIPGQPLDSLADDAEASRIAAVALRRLLAPVPASHEFPSVADRCLGLVRLRARFDGAAGPFPPGPVARAEQHARELLASAPRPMLLHGDFHHGNVLSAGPGQWRVIDPKGLIGDPAYDVAAFLYNPMPALSRHTDAALRQVLSTRLAIFAEELGVDRQRLRAWGVVGAVLSAWWAYEDHGRGYEHAIRVAGTLTTLR